MTGAPLSLHPDNPRYFLLRGEPTVLITSAEHYGAVLNADFDYARYLQALHDNGLNHTRIFVGAYCEPDGAFRITCNTLAPAPERFVCPWARSDEAGYANGGNRFDLSRWDEGYFERLRDFVERASEAGVVVEVNLFCPFYRDEMWDLSPMKASNNVNGVGDVAKEEVYTVDGSEDLLDVQVDMAQKVAAELRDDDNLFYEVMNEPYTRDVPMAWQHRIVDALVEVESDGAERHLISINVANKQAVVEDPHPAVSLYNFHYAWPPDAVALNRHLNLPIGCNETGFAGQEDFPYRREGWAFLMAGGALFDHLDYSFAVGCEDGTFEYPETQPGGGSKALRTSLAALAAFIGDFDFVRMAPLQAEAIGGLPDLVAAHGLGEEGRQLALYLCSAEAPLTSAAGVDVVLAVGAGSYEMKWIDPRDGRVLKGEALEHGGGELSLRSPAFTEDVALRLVAIG